MKFVKWFRSGGQFPQTEDASFYVITPKKVIKCYEAEVPFIVEDRVFATGSGRDYALAAMHCGKSAKEAVEIAAFFDINTGKGIDVFKP